MLSFATWPFDQLCDVTGICRIILRWLVRESVRSKIKRLCVVFFIVWSTGGSASTRFFALFAPWTLWNQLRKLPEIDKDSEIYWTIMISSYSCDDSFDRCRAACPFYCAYPSHVCVFLRPRMILTLMKKLAERETRALVPFQHCRPFQFLIDPFANRFRNGADETRKRGDV